MLEAGDEWYWQAHEVDPSEVMAGAQDRHYPERGQFSFVTQPTGKFSGARVIDVTIRPWDEHPDAERKVLIETWHWNIFPPFTRGSDSALTQAIANAVRKAVDRPADPQAAPALGGEHRSMRPGLENLVAFANGFYSGSAPLTDAAFNSLEAMRVKSIVSVDGVCPNTWLPNTRGIVTIHLPISYDGITPERQLELARAVRDARASGAVYIHCHHGKHRSPAAAATVAAMLGWETPGMGVARMNVAGTSADYMGLYACATNARPVDAAVLDAVSVTFVECEPPTDLVATMVAMADAAGTLRKRCGESSAFHRATAGVTEPVALAASVSEHLRRLAGGTQALGRGEEFVADLRACSEKASALEAMLIAKGRSLKGENKGALVASMKALDASCAACHAKYRD